MIKACEQFSLDYDIVFNPSKSKMLLFNTENDFVPLKMKGEVIPISNGEKHLGNYIGQDCATIRIEKVIQELYISANKLSYNFKYVELDTLYYLYMDFTLLLHHGNLHHGNQQPEILQGTAGLTAAIVTLALT